MYNYYLPTYLYLLGCKLANEADIEIGYFNLVSIGITTKFEKASSIYGELFLNEKP